MVVNFEFLGNEPIENIVTCLNYKVDKVVYFGYKDTIDAQRKKTDNFLKKYCGVQSTYYCELSRNDLQEDIEKMRVTIEHELNKNSDIYFDITGGEWLVFVAFGHLAREYDTPMHVYDIPTNQLIELEDGAKRKISQNVATQKVELSVERYIELRGGVINKELHKDIKKEMSEELYNDAVKIWSVIKKYSELWNSFSNFTRDYLVPDVQLKVNRDYKTIVSGLISNETKLKTVAGLNSILDDLGQAGVLVDLVHDNKKLSFSFKNHEIKELIWEGGSILELLTYNEEKKNSDDCVVAIHIDWDGVIHNVPGLDVVNEIDVLSISGLVPTFISCKSGRMGAQQSLHALYELQTVAERFGGKYAKKILKTVNPLNETYVLRAKEMGIEIQ